MKFDIEISELRKLLDDIEAEGYNYITFAEVKHNRKQIDIFGTKVVNSENQLSFDKYDK